MTTSVATNPLKIVLNNARLAFPNLFKPQINSDTGNASFGAAFIIPTDHSQVAEINAKIDLAAKNKWGEKAPAVLKALRAGDKVALHNGDTKAQYAGYEGNLFVNANNKAKPAVRDVTGKVELNESSGKPYSGCYVNAIIELWAQDNANGKRVNASLLGVQFVRDGEAFAGGSVASDDDFADLSAEGADDVF